MPTPELWRAVGSLANQWRASPIVGAVARQLPGNATTPGQVLPRLLQQVTAGAGALVRNPLLLATRLPLAVSVASEVEADVLQARHGDWMGAVGRVEAAHRRTIAWLRARLPGYPQLLGPHLAPGSPWTTFEYTPRLIWAPAERAQGLQFADAPGDIPEILGVVAPAADALLNATRFLAVALKGTNEWHDLADAGRRLDDAGRAQLREAWLEARDQLADPAVDAHEPSLALPRAAYREHVLTRTVDALTGTARTYAEALDTADRLVERACSDVLGQIVFYPLQTLSADDIEVTPGPRTTVRFAAPDPGAFLVQPGSVAWLADALAPDAVLITGTSMSFRATGEQQVHMTAEVLTGTSDAWKP